MITLILWLMSVINTDHTHHLLFEALCEYSIDLDPQKGGHTVSGCEDGVMVGHTLRLIGKDGFDLTVKVVEINHYKNAQDIWIARVTEVTEDEC